MYRCRKYVQVYTYVHTWYGTVLIRPGKYSKTFCADFYKTYGTRGTEFPCWVSQTHTNTALTQLDPRYTIKALSHKNEKCTTEQCDPIVVQFCTENSEFFSIEFMKTWKMSMISFKEQYYEISDKVLFYQHTSSDLIRELPSTD